MTTYHDRMTTDRDGVSEEFTIRWSFPQNPEYEVAGLFDPDCLVISQCLTRATQRHTSSESTS